MNSTLLILGAIGTALVATAAITMILIPVFQEKVGLESKAKAAGKGIHSADASLEDILESKFEKPNKPSFIEKANATFQKIKEKVKEARNKASTTESPHSASSKAVTSSATPKSTTPFVRTHIVQVPVAVSSVPADDSLMFQIGGDSLMATPRPILSDRPFGIVPLARVPLIPFTTLNSNNGFKRLESSSPKPADFEAKKTTTVKPTASTSAYETTARTGRVESATSPAWPLRSGSTTARPILILNPRPAGEANELPSLVGAMEFRPDTASLRYLKRSSGSVMA